MASEPVTRAVMHNDGECHGYEDEPCDISNHPVIELVERGAEFRIAAEMVGDEADKWGHRTPTRMTLRGLSVKLKELADGR